MLPIFNLMLIKFLGVVPHFDVFQSTGPQLCLRSVPLGLSHDYVSALVCGAGFPNNETKQRLIDGGLIHLMVLSGLHLFYLDRWLWFLGPRLRSVVLGFYCVLTGFAPTLLRAFLRRAVQPSLQGRWRTTQLQTDAVLIAALLIFYPPWLLSRSFMMSWMGGLALRLPILYKPHAALERALKVYALLFPFCGASPLGVLSNLILAPVFGLVLFPVSVLSLIVPHFMVVSDLVWWMFQRALPYWPSAAPTFFDFDGRWLCLLPPLVHGTFLVWEVRWRRAYAFSYLPS